MVLIKNMFKNTLNKRTTVIAFLKKYSIRQHIDYGECCVKLVMKPNCCQGN